MTLTSTHSRLGRTRLLAGAALGLVGGFTTTFFATSAQFVRPITEEFGWGRTELSVVIVLAMLGSALAAPPAGRLVARFGPRPVVAASGVFLALGLALLSRAPASPTYFGVVAFFLGVLSIGTTPVALLVTVPRFFDRRLGLALGAVMGGSALGAGVLQVVVGGLLESRGWRPAYLLLATAAVVLLALTALIGFPAGTGPERAEVDEPTAAELPGLTVREALRSPAFRLMLGAMLLASIGPVGLTLHFVAFITDRGIDPVTAAGAAASGGFGVALGRLVSGALLDRVNAVRLTGVILAVAALGFVVPAAAANATVPVYAASALVGGFAFGAEGDILPFLVRRYAGVRHYSRVPRSRARGLRPRRRRRPAAVRPHLRPAGHLRPRALGRRDRHGRGRRRAAGDGAVPLPARRRLVGPTLRPEHRDGAGRLTPLSRPGTAVARACPAGAG